MILEDPNSVIALKHNEEHEIQSIFIQTSAMSRAFQQYSEVLIMDTTYKLCKNKMSLIVFGAIDCFGAGRTSGYALISSEKKESQAFNDCNIGCKEAMAKVPVVVIDKDQSDIAAI